MRLSLLGNPATEYYQMSCLFNTIQWDLIEWLQVLKRILGHHYSHHKKNDINHLKNNLFCTHVHLS